MINKPSESMQMCPLWHSCWLFETLASHWWDIVFISRNRESSSSTSFSLMVTCIGGLRTGSCRAPGIRGGSGVGCPGITALHGWDRRRSTPWVHWGCWLRGSPWGGGRSALERTGGVGWSKHNIKPILKRIRGGAEEESRKKEKMIAG